MTKRIDRLLKMTAPGEQTESDIKTLMAAAIVHGMKAKGWSQGQLAAAINKHDSTISIWLSGTHNFTIETVSKIEKVLDIKLLNHNNERQPNNIEA